MFRSIPYSLWQVERRGSENPQLMPAPHSSGLRPSMTHNSPVRDNPWDPL